jgi:hypothetical protein
MNFRNGLMFSGPLNSIPYFLRSPASYDPEQAFS